MKLKKISGLFSTVPTVLSTVPKQPYTFKGKVTRLDAPIGAGVPVILHDRATGVCIETSETDADSFVVFQNLDKTKSYYIVAIDAENLFQSIVYDLTWQTSNNFDYNPNLQYTDKLAQSSLKDFYNYYQQESLLESDALVFSISSPSVYDDNVLTWNASGSLVTDIIDDYPSFIFNASSRYLYLETTPTYAQQPFTFETFFQIDNLKASTTHYLFTQISTGTLRHSFYIDDQGYLTFSRDYAPTISVRSLSKIKDGWNHAALTFDGNNLHLFLNGKLEATAADTIGLQGFQNHFGIGYLLSGVMAYTSWKHSCEYLTDFQPKTQNYSKKQFKDINDVFDASVVLKTEVRSNLVQSLMVDTAKHMPFTIGATTLIQSDSAVSINNSFARSTVMSSDYVLKGDFCIELTYSLNSTVSYPTLFSNQSVTSEWIANNWALTVNHASSRNKYAIYRANLTTLVSTYPVLLREITTIAIDKQGTTVRVFFNGFLVDTFTNVPAFDTRLNSYIAFGRDISYTLYDAKLTNGISRYQSDYTPTWLSTWTDQNLAAEQHMLLNLSFKKSLVSFSTRLQAVLSDVSLSSIKSVNGTKSAFFKEAQLLLNSDLYVPREMFTLELRAYLNEHQEDFKTIVQLYRDDSNILRIGYNASRQLCYSLADGEVVTLEDVVFKENFDHLVIQRQGSIFKILFEGELVATIPFSLVLAYVSLSVMSNFDRTNAAEGYVNNLYLYKNYLKYSDIYEVPYEEIVQDTEEKEPEVVVTPYTTSALDFENGLVDQIGTTVWQKEGTADITSTNKIFGNNSFETKAIGDSLYTNSNVITGGSTPFTIEGYYLFRPDFNTTSTGTDLSLFSLCNDSGYYQGYFLSRSSMNIGTYRAIQFSKPILDDSFINKRKIKVNEINKITISYDGSALRSFINDELDGIYGTSIGLEKSSQPLRLMSYNFNTSKNTTSGLIDNINIHDGVATKVRDYGPYEENLIVDLAFDGENNSTKIVDNGISKETIQSELLFQNGLQDSANENNIWITNELSVLDGNLNVNTYDNIITLNDGLHITNGTIIEFNFTPKSRADSGYGSGVFQIGTQNNFDDGIGIYYWSHGGLNAGKDYYSYISGPTIPIGTSCHVVLKVIQPNVVEYIVDGISYGTLTLNQTINNKKITLGYSNRNWNTFRDATYSNFKVRNNRSWTFNGDAKISTDQKFDGFSSLYLTNNSSYISTNLTTTLSKDFTISFNYRPSNITLGSAIFDSRDLVPSYTGLLITTPSADPTSLHLYTNGNGVDSWGVSLNSTSFMSVDTNYKIDIVCKDNLVSFYVNGLLKASQQYNFDVEVVLDNKLITLGRNINGTGGNRSGYIKNFKIYKDVAVIPESPVGKVQLDFDNNVIDKYGNSTWTNNGVTFDQVNSVKGHSAYFNGNDSTYLFLSQNNNLNFENYNFEISMDFKSNTTRQYDMLLASNHTSYNNNETFQFSHGMYSGLFFRFGNKDIDVVSNINPLNNQYYSTSIRRYNDTFSLELNDVLIGQCNSALPLNITNGGGTRLGGIGWGSGYNYNGYIDNFKSIKNLQEPVIIDKPAIHLPLETNATNIGFSQLTINSVGAPTYHVVAGKKCIKFEQNKYLTINSNNIFNLGTNSDFYIEFDAYIESSQKTRFNTLISNGYASGYNSNISAIVISRESDGNNLYIDHGWYRDPSNKFIFDAWNNIKLYRQGNNLYLSLNDKPFLVNAEKSFNFSNPTFNIGRSALDSSAYMNGYMSNFKMFVGTSEIPETYNDKKVLDLDFKPTRKSYLFKDNNNKCIIHPVNITQRDYQNGLYCCSFNGTDQYLQLGKNELFNFGYDDFVLEFYFQPVADGTWNILLGNGSTVSDTNYHYVGVSENTSSTNPSKIYFTLGSVNIISSNQVSYNRINHLIITRQGNNFQIILNDVVTTGSLSVVANFNYGDKTQIGSTQVSNWVNHLFKGQIYSVKVYRNTSDTTVLTPKNEVLKIKDVGIWVQSVASVGVSSTWGGYDPQDTSKPTWLSRYSGTLSFGLFEYTNVPTPNAVLTYSGPHVIGQPFLGSVFKVMAGNGTWSSTSIGCNIEILDASNNVLAALKWYKDGTYRHAISYGASLTSQTRTGVVGSYPQTNGELVISNTGITFTNQATTNYNASFTYNKDLSTAKKLRITNLSSLYDYSGTGAAYFVLEKIQ